MAANAHLQTRQPNKMVFLQGVTSRGPIWKSMAPLLDEKFSLLNPESWSKGGGRPARDLRPRLEKLPLYDGQSVLEAMQQIRFFPTWMVGSSMGATVACAAAYLRPELFKGLVLLDPVISGSRYPVAEWIRRLAQFNIPILVLRSAGSLLESRAALARERRSFRNLFSVHFKDAPEMDLALPVEQSRYYCRIVTQFIEANDTYPLTRLR
jgi:hypothetical protein